MLVDFGRCNWDYNVEVDGAIVYVSREEMLQALTEIKSGKAPGSLEVSLELIATSGEVGIYMMAEICQGVLDGMPVEWTLGIVVSIFKGTDEIWNCSCHRA